MNRILAIDNDVSFLMAIQSTLEYNKYDVETLLNPLHTTKLLKNHEFDCVLLDVAMPGMNGLELLNRISELYPLLPVIMVSGESTISIAVDAIHQGAYDFLEKPIETKRLLITIQKAIEKKSWAVEKTILLNELSENYRLVGRSESLKKLLLEINQLAPTDTRIIITGETGTGKELVARALHHNSPRNGKKFIKLNCAAIPAELMESELFGHKKGSFTGAVNDHKGKFELADGGTLFLDEIGDLDFRLQAKLLRVLQDGEFERIGDAASLKSDVRIISATNKNLWALVKKGQFREDLYHRIKVFEINIPPLRSRKDDVQPLAEHFLNEFAETYNKRLIKFAPQALHILLNYDWSGNVRELKNVIHKISVFAVEATISADLVLKALGVQDESISNKPASLSLKENVESVEREHILKVLAISEWKINKAAEMMGIERTTLFKKMKRYAIKKPAK